MNILDGKYVANKLTEELKEKIDQLPQTNKPELVIITVGEDPASKVYVRNKLKACENVGIIGLNKIFDANTEAQIIEQYIEELNNDSNCTGIIVQLPLPKHLEEKAIIEKISPDKDVDGLSDKNRLDLLDNKATVSSCTPQGIIDLLDFYHIPIEGKHAVIIGRSNIVGKPIATMLLNRNATVTICHSKTKYLEDITSQADILICAVGKAKLINRRHVKNDAVVIDVGINRDSIGKLVGDVDFDSVIDNCSYITPVPGGVGPMTVYEVVNNVYKLYVNSKLKD